jgi:tripartite-type tricarboxylate transporter receptor subunit TctC
MKTLRKIGAALAFAGLMVGLAPAARADAVADFYKGKTVDLYIGYSVGGGYDVYARLVARYLGKHIPGNPNVVPRNMEGAGSLRLANWLYNIGPKDGTAIGAVARGAAFDPLFGSPGAQFDATKMHWIGSANNEVSVCASWDTSGVKTFDDLLKTPLVMGGSGGAADTDQFVYVINGVLNSKMKVIAGYPGGNEINLAMERGEVQGRCGWSWSSVKSTHPEWLRDKKVNILVQLSLTKHEDLPNVPLIMDLAKSPTEKQIFALVFARNVMGRPFLAPPGVPAERVEALRKAFMATLTDKDLLAEAEKTNLEVNPVPGAEIQKIVLDAYATAPDIVKRTGDLLKGPN